MVCCCTDGFRHWFGGGQAPLAAPAERVCPVAAAAKKAQDLPSGPGDAGAGPSPSPPGPGDAGAGGEACADHYPAKVHEAAAAEEGDGFYPSGLTVVTDDAELGLTASTDDAASSPRPRAMTMPAEGALRAASDAQRSTKKSRACSVQFAPEDSVHCFSEASSSRSPSRTPLQSLAIFPAAPEEFQLEAGRLATGDQPFVLAAGTAEAAAAATSEPLEAGRVAAGDQTFVLAAGTAEAEAASASEPLEAAPSAAAVDPLSTDRPALVDVLPTESPPATADVADAGSMASVDSLPNAMLQELEDTFDFQDGAFRSSVSTLPSTSMRPYVPSYDFIGANSLNPGNLSGSLQWERGPPEAQLGKSQSIPTFDQPRSNGGFSDRTERFECEAAKVVLERDGEEDSGGGRGVGFGGRPSRLQEAALADCLSVDALRGRWCMVSDPSSVIIVQDGGRTLYGPAGAPAKHHGPDLDLTSRPRGSYVSAGGDGGDADGDGLLLRRVIVRGDGWEVDQGRSTTDRLFWVKLGEDPDTVEWVRLPDSLDDRDVGEALDYKPSTSRDEGPRCPEPAPGEGPEGWFAALTCCGAAKVRTAAAVAALAGGQRPRPCGQSTFEPPPGACMCPNGE